MVLAFLAVARAEDCPEGTAAVGDGCIVLAGEIIHPSASELDKVVYAEVTTSVDVKRCLVPVAGQRGFRVDLTVDVAKGRAAGVVLTSPSGAPLSVESCLADEVARLALPTEPALYRARFPLVLE